MAKIQRSKSPRFTRQEVTWMPGSFGWSGRSRSTMQGWLLVAAVVLTLTPAPGAAQRYVATADTLHPRIKYADSLVSANERCMVAQQKLNRRVRPIYVNGIPMGFC